MLSFIASCGCLAIAPRAYAAGSLCSLTRNNQSGKQGYFKGSSAAEKDADDVYKTLGLGKRNIPIYASFEIGNAAAFGNLNGNGPAIAYNPDFMTGLYAINDWAPASVIAHEIGHHFSTAKTSHQSHRRELGADEVSGCAMAWMDASEEQAIAAMTKGLPINSGSSTHPGTQQRVTAITQAFNNCNKIKLQTK